MKIRNNIYETNSSSSHSFSMGPKGRFSGNFIDINDDGNIYISGDEWDQDSVKTNSQISKLSYLYSLVYTCADDPKEYFKEIEKVVCDFTGAKKVVIPEVLEDTMVEVDHQSRDIIDLRDILNPEFVKEFVFNDSTWLYLTWDWDSRDEDFYEPTEKSLTKIYRFEFDLPGLPKEETTIEVSQKDLEERTVDYKLKTLFLDITYLPDEKRFKRGKEKGGWYHWSGYKFGNDNLDDLQHIEVIPKVSLI